VRLVGGEKTNSEVIYNIITENQTKCYVCGHNDFTISVKSNFIPLILEKAVQQNHGIEVILMICKKCGHVIMFSDQKSKD